jgi:hypothetical protein
MPPSIPVVRRKLEAEHILLLRCTLSHGCQPDVHAAQYLERSSSKNDIGRGL